MGSPTMSTQSPQTGGKSGQAPGQAGGKGFGGGGFQPENSNLSQDMLSNLQQSSNQQADGNNQFGAPLPGMGQTQPMGLGTSPQGQDMLGSGVGQSTNPYQANLSQKPSTGEFDPNNLPDSMKTVNFGRPTQNSFNSGMGQGNITYPSQSGQPMMGMPNQYSNTVGQPGGMEDGSAYKGTGGGKGAAAQNGKTGA